MALHLLIIDDDPALRRLYETVLGHRDGNCSKRDEVTLDVAPSADAGRSLLASKRYDLALVDLNLNPTADLAGFDQSGLSVVAHIRNVLPKTEAIIMSSQDDEPTVRACLNAGADGFVSKNSAFVATLRRQIARTSRLRQREGRSVDPDAVTASAFVRA